MYDFSKELEDFYENSVRLSTEQQGEMRERRNTNRSRLKSGLSEQESPPKIEKFVIQGSYAMKTMVQDPDNDYDIDDGVVFDSEDENLQDPKKMRELVCEALQRDEYKFNNPPEVKDNCVRVLYNTGYHVDIPVYKSSPPSIFDTESEEILEIASEDEWKKSDPKGVTEWFENLVEDSSPESDKIQARKIVQLLKFIAKMIKPKSPSGLIISKLIESCYQPNERIDVSFKDTAVAIQNRFLIYGLGVDHPIFSDQVLASGSEQYMEEFRDRIDEIVNALSRNIDTKDEAIDAWNVVFPDAFEVEDSAAAKSSGLLTNDKYDSSGSLKRELAAVDKQGGGRFA